MSNEYDLKTLRAVRGLLLDIHCDIESPDEPQECVDRQEYWAALKTIQMTLKRFDANFPCEPVKKWRFVFTYHSKDWPITPTTGLTVDRYKSAEECLVFLKSLRDGREYLECVALPSTEVVE
jgi:hypothetical protein